MRLSARQRHQASKSYGAIDSTHGVQSLVLTLRCSERLGDDAPKSAVLSLPLNFHLRYGNVQRQTLTKWSVVFEVSITMTNVGITVGPVPFWSGLVWSGVVPP